jgi:hypothetical protein
MFKIFEQNELKVIETKCPKATCSKPYRIDEHHPEYRRIHAALSAGDRSLLHCYHAHVYG